MTKINAPFTNEQVDNLNRFQRFGIFHPFTCGNDDHEGNDRTLVATTEGWVCPKDGCGYTQKWAHGFMSEFTQKEEDEVRSRLTAGGFKI